MSSQLENLIEQLRLQDQQDNFEPEPVAVSTVPEEEEEAEGYKQLITDPYSNRGHWRNTQDISSPTNKKSLSELGQDDEFSKRALRFLEGVGSNDNIFEYLRDSDYSLSSAFTRSFQSDNWTEEQKEDYAYLRDQFDNTDIEGFKEWFGAFKDIGIDIVADPLNLISAFFAAGSGGASLTASAALNVAAKQGVKKFTQAQLQDKAIKGAVKKEAFKLGVTSSAKVGAVEGMAWAGLHNYFLQDIDINLGINDDLDLGSIAASTGLGGVIGGALVGGVKAGTMKFKRAPETNENMPQVLKDKEYKFSNEDVIEEAIDEVEVKAARADINETSEIDESIIANDNIITKGKKKLEEFTGINHINVILANTIGKPVTRFVQYLKDAPSLENLLASIRYDYKTTLTKGQKGVTEIELMVNGPDGKPLKTVETFGEDFSRRNGELQYGLLKAFNVLYRVGWRAKIFGQQNDELAILLRDPDVTIRRVGVDVDGNDIYKPFVKGKELKGNTKYGEIDAIDEDVLTAYVGARKQLDKAFIDGQAAGIFKAGTTKVKNYLPRIFNYAKLSDPDKRARFENKLIEAGHADPINEKEFKMFYEVDPKTKQPKDSTVRGIEENSLGKDEQIFIETDAEGKQVGINFIKKAGVESGEVADATPEQLLLAKKLKASKIVQDMLDNRWTPTELRIGGTKSAQANGYLQPRRFTNLKDNEIAEVLETDVQTILETYFTNISRSTSRARYFGKTLTEINDRKIQPLINELVKSGNFTTEEANKIGDKAFKMIQRVGGFETDAGSKLKSTAAGRFLSDFGKISQQLAHLPLATLSSVTEPLILLSRTGPGEGFEVGGAMAQALRMEGSNIIDRTIKFSKRIGGSEKILDKKTGKMVRVSKGLKDLDDETWEEIYKTGLALEQSVLERLEGLMGEGVQSNIGKALQQGFFKTNLLTQWTKAVQLASFTTGKRLIKKNTRLLAEGKLSKNKKEYLTQQLNDLGIYEDQAIAWHRKYSKNGKFDEAAANKDIFYKQNITKGANRFTKEIILNPSTAEANRPLWFSTPSAQLLVQFAGYPTVFNNTILKRFSNESIKRPGSVGMGKVIPTMLLMTGVAHVGNLIRSNGNSVIDQETGRMKDDGAILLEAVRRWGGIGPLDYGYRYNQEAGRNVGDVTSILKTLAGPAPQDVIDAILYRKGIGEVIATNFPGYSSYDVFLGDGTKKEIRRIARGSPKEKPTKNPYAQFSKGGIVLNVPNVKDEPDEMVSRVTGIPFDVMAGNIMVDEEERLFKYSGGTVYSKLQKRKQLALGGLLGKGGLLFDHTNPLDYLMLVPGIGALGIGAKALSSTSKINKARKLPKTQYHGGYSSVEKGQGNLTGFYSTPDVSYANVYADPAFRTIKGRGKPELYKLDLSKAKNIELTDKPSKKLLKSIDKKLESLYEKERISGRSSLSVDEKDLEVSLSLMFKSTAFPKGGKFGIRGSEGYIRKPAVLDFFRKEGIEILTDSTTLKKGVNATGTSAEYYLLKDFPKIKLTAEDKAELVRLGEMYKVYKTKPYNEGGPVTESNLNNFISLALEINNEGVT